MRRPDHDLRRPGGRRPPRAEGAGPAAGGPPAGPVAPAGTLWLHGLHPVAAALANPARRLRRLLLTEEAEAALAARVPRPWRIAAERADDRARFATFLPPDAVHQGAALLAEPLPDLPLDRALEHGGAGGPVLALDQVTDPRNIGAILRSAAAFGAGAVVMQDRHAPPETGALARAASGALEVVPVVRVVNLARSLREMKEAGLWVVGLDAEAPVTLAQVQAGLAGRRVALVLGAEGEGMRRLTRETCDELARLPIAPEVESLNVSAAAAVALYELARA
jgi:23S rRNA (guanosine2251-2'-O)-methyltransferase